MRAARAIRLRAIGEEARTAAAFGAGAGPPAGPEDTGSGGTDKDSYVAWKRAWVALGGAVGCGSAAGGRIGKPFQRWEREAGESDDIRISLAGRGLSGLCAGRETAAPGPHAGLVAMPDGGARVPGTARGLKERAFLW